MVSALGGLGRPLGMDSRPRQSAASPLVRRAVRQDARALTGLIEALARYEKLEPPDAAARRRLVRDLFGPQPRLEAWIGELGGRPVAYALAFETYSSFLALPTLYLEDLFVLPEYRRRRIGAHLFRALVAEAHRRGCGRMEWAVLAWNRPAIDFYEQFGARRLSDWQLYRLVRADMERILRRR
jgi:GNAT superfamily N-acetyltransferase